MKVKYTIRKFPFARNGSLAEQPEEQGKQGGAIRLVVTGK